MSSFYPYVLARAVYGFEALLESEGDFEAGSYDGGGQLLNFSCGRSDMYRIGQIETVRGVGYSLNSTVAGLQTLKAVSL